MRTSWLVCVLLGSLARGQAAPAPAGAQSTPPGAQAMRPPAATVQAVDNSASVAPDAAVLTVEGVCSPAPKLAAAKTAEPAKTDSADCKTVITREEFEKLANSIAPNITPQLRKQLATMLPQIMAFSQAAKKKGLDKSDQYKETVKFAQMQILSNQLRREVQEEAGQVPQSEIEDYYKKNPEAYEQFNLDRIFIPRTKQADADAKDDEKAEKLTEEQQKAKQAEAKTQSEAAEKAMTDEANSIRARAAAGEDFLKLQKEAYETAGLKIDSPSVNLHSVRRTGLPPAHSAVFDLKPGEVSEVINDSGGHYIYKVIGRDELPLDDKVGTEIRTQLTNDRAKEAMDQLNNSYKVVTNDAYFGAGGAAMPPTRMPNQRMPPSPASPPTRPTPPPSQTPGQNPDKNPN